MSSSLSSIRYSNNNDGYNQPKISASTKRKLESLGIDPTLVTSETQAISLIAARQSEKSFQAYAGQSDIERNETSQTNMSESSLLSEATTLAEQLGVGVSSDDTFDDITALIANAIQDMINKSANDPQALQRAQQYQVQLSQLTSQYNDVTTSNTNLYSAMSLQAYNTRYMLGL